MKIQRWLGVGATIVFTGLIVWLAWQYDWKKVASILSQAKWHYLTLIALAVLAEQALRAIKWRILLRALTPVPVITVFNAIMAGFAAGVIMPFGVSPLVRSWLLARRCAVPMMTVLTTASIDRLVDAAVFLLFAMAGLLILQLPSDDAPVRNHLYVGVAINIVVVTGIAFALTKYRSSIADPDNRLFRWIGLLPERLAQSLRLWSQNVAQGVGFPRLTDGGYWIILITVLMRCLTPTHFLFAGLALDIQFTAPEYVVLLVIPGFAYVLARLIRAPGGFVVGGVLALTLIGIAEETAIALMTLIQVTTATSVCLVGIPTLIRQGVTIAQLRSGGQPPEAHRRG